MLRKRHLAGLLIALTCATGATTSTFASDNDSGLLGEVLVIVDDAVNLTGDGSGVENLVQDTILAPVVETSVIDNAGVEPVVEIVDTIVVENIVQDPVVIVEDTVDGVVGDTQILNGADVPVGDVIPVDATLTDVVDGGIINVDDTLGNGDVLPNTGLLNNVIGENALSGVLGGGVLNGVLGGGVTDVVDDGVLTDLVGGDVVTDVVNGGVLTGVVDGGVLTDIIGGDVLSGGLLDGTIGNVADGGVLNGDILGEGARTDLLGGDILNGLTGDVTLIGGDLSLVDGMVVNDLLDVSDVVNIGTIIGGDVVGGDLIDTIIGGDVIGGDVIGGDVIGGIDLDLDLTPGQDPDNGDTGGTTVIIDNSNTNTTNNTTNNTTTIVNQGGNTTIINRTIHQTIYQQGKSSAGQTIVHRTNQVVRYAGTGQSATLVANPQSQALVQSLPSTGTGTVAVASASSVLVLSSLAAALAGAGIRVGGGRRLMA